MKNVKFLQEEDGNFFTYDESDGHEGSFAYRFSVDHLWTKINPDDFIVELLINPILNRESNVYYLANIGGERIGYIFPISVIDSDSDFSEYKHINNYVFVAFYTLLRRIHNVKEPCQFFSENFEENICVCVFLRSLVKTNYPLAENIHILRKLGYSYFEPKNTIKAVTGYKASLYLNGIKKKISLDFKVPDLYSNPKIDSLLRILPKADNLTHRFVLLYQFIEVLLDETSSKLLSTEINKFRSESIAVNDFYESVRDATSERKRIKDIFDWCNIASSDEVTRFKDYCKVLFDLVGYAPSRSSDADIFYSFRNQMTHSYRKLYKFEKELAETIQCFEVLVMKIIDTYPY